MSMERRERIQTGRSVKGLLQSSSGGMKQPEGDKGRRDRFVSWALRVGQLCGCEYPSKRCVQQEEVGEKRKRGREGVQFGACCI